MNKTELINAIADKADLNKASAAKALEAFIETVSETLKKGDSVSLVGFGTFSVKKRAARSGRNPQTGEVMEIAAATLPHWKPGKSIKDAVNAE